MEPSPSPPSVPSSGSVTSGSGSGVVSASFTCSVPADDTGYAADDTASPIAKFTLPASAGTSIFQLPSVPTTPDATVTPSACALIVVPPGTEFPSSVTSPA